MNMKRIGDQGLQGNPEDLLQLKFVEIIDILEIDNIPVFQVRTSSIVENPLQSTVTRSRILIDNKN